MTKKKINKQFLKSIKTKSLFFQNEIDNLELEREDTNYQYEEFKGRHHQRSYRH